MTLKVTTSELGAATAPLAKTAKHQKVHKTVGDIYCCLQSLRQEGVMSKSDAQAHYEKIVRTLDQNGFHIATPHAAEDVDGLVLQLEEREMEGSSFTRPMLSLPKRGSPVSADYSGRNGYSKPLN
ncbi:hypothetical protein M406DRAFT_330472 [Cryphonectria parasitica EP155]|uniref:Uncharacterized protein n=1 Tax=Cryphonectria parasitica (strain ATCC 38755 / EP155) TaxID=660469 RepID=A0A9P4XZC2_CRYP1|nr:uncharacterized protein M406DRAFT_330472 [Cryphonectria parasitica EP155]KAF3764122.1 hypothetical protein M406DRAFT_330472 [Cryphonectria parasitica EP155]